MKIKIKQNIKSLKIRQLTRKTILKEKEYLVLGIEYDCFRIIDANGEPILLPQKIFEILDASIPKDWVKRNHRPGYNIDPKFAAKAGFYEDLFDGKKYAVKAFHSFVIKNGYMSQEDWDQKWTKGRLLS